jgi:hypothetical protein
MRPRGPDTWIAGRTCAEAYGVLVGVGVRVGVVVGVRVGVTVSVGVHVGVGVGVPVGVGVGVSVGVGVKVSVGAYFDKVQLPAGFQPSCNPSSSRTNR